MTHQTQTLPLGAQGLGPAYFRECDRRGSVRASLEGHSVKARDMPLGLDPAVRADMARGLGGDSAQAVARAAAGLEMHTPAAYWARVERDCQPALDRRVRACAQAGDEKGALLAQTARQELNEAALDGARRGDGVVLATFLSLAAASVPGQSEKDRRLFAAHAVVHSRASNRDHEALEKALPDVAPAGQDMARYLLRKGHAGDVMALVDRFAGFDDASFKVQARAARQEAIAEVAGVSHVETDSAFVASLLAQGDGRGKAQACETRANGIAPVGAQGLRVHREANAAVLALGDVSVAKMKVLAADMVLAQRQAALEQDKVPMRPRAVADKVR